MSGYLDEFGVADARRENIVKRLILVAVVLVSVGGILYFQFRNWREERLLNSFRELLEKKDYPSAYGLWGCSEAEPCPDYSYEKFLEDWGPESLYPDVNASEVIRTRTCDEGIIQTWRFGEDDEIYLYVDSDERVISFAPWGTCRPRLPADILERQAPL
jgi:hypothetical protein